MPIDPHDRRLVASRMARGVHPERLVHNVAHVRDGQPGRLEPPDEPSGPQRVRCPFLAGVMRPRAGGRAGHDYPSHVLVLRPLLREGRLAALTRR